MLHQVGELAHLLIGDLASQPVGVAAQLVQAHLDVRAGAQHLGIGPHHHCQAVVRIGILKGGSQVPGVEIAIDFAGLAGVGILPAQLDGSHAPIRARNQFHFVESRCRHPRADLAGVHTVIAEVLIGHLAVLITDQAVVGHHVGVEIHLHLGVVGNHLQAGGQFLDK